MNKPKGENSLMTEIFRKSPEWIQTLESAIITLRLWTLWRTFRRWKTI